MAPELLPGEVPVLRTCAPGGRSYGGFVWPLTEGSIVEAPDWNPEPRCGGGLHGLLRGEGIGSLLDWSAEAVWMVVAVTESFDLGGKVKFQRCRVLHVGDRASATALLDRLAPSAAIVGVTRSGGADSTLTGGDYSTLTGGADSTLTGGYRSTLTGGNRSTLTGGDYSKLTGGYRSTLTGGNRSTLTGGADSTLTGGYGSTLTGGNYSTLTGGYGSTLTGGNRSTLTGRRWDGNRTRIAVAYVGEDGIKPGVAYRVKDGKFVEVRDGE